MSRWPLLLGIAACRLGTPDLETLVQDHMDETGLDYHDCGDAAASCDSLDGAVACFQSAWADCTPSRLDVVTTTVEGDPITTVLLIEPEGVNCMIYQVVDSTQDAFGGGDIETAVCDELLANVDGTCPPVYAEGCISADCGSNSDCG